ncbi:galactose oxidase [Abortiporus biennis]|nr:galactose oxidase [Abortiporus biennis]
MADRSTRLIEVNGTIPKPRIGHACASFSRIFILWGGDVRSKGKTNPEVDNALYLLNIDTREWTQVRTVGPVPSGRYGHTMCTIGTSLYLFGGQDGNNFFNDAWRFELHTLKTFPRWQPIKPRLQSPLPERRTNHTCISYDNGIIIFGGTDHKYHYNDTWHFDPDDATWSKLDCVGYLMSPREGHAAAQSKGFMYVFGGRDVEGKELGDIGALRLSDKRWFMFQKLGPAPSTRSGHCMASHGSQVVVFGGRSDSASTETTEENVLYVLETKCIKFPVQKSKSSPPHNTNEA